MLCQYRLIFYRLKRLFMKKRYSKIKFVEIFIKKNNSCSVIAFSGVLVIEKLIIYLNQKTL